MRETAVELQHNLGKLLSAYEELKGETALMDLKFYALQDEHDDLSVGHEDLQEELDVLQGEYDELEEEHGDLKEEFYTLREKCEKQEEALSTYHTLVATLTHEQKQAA
jgi:chromosome segregation ATPase